MQTAQSRKQMQENTSSGHICNLITQHWRIGPASVRAEARKQISAETHKLRFKLEFASTVLNTSNYRILSVGRKTRNITSCQTECSVKD